MRTSMHFPSTSRRKGMAAGIAPAASAVPAAFASAAFAVLAAALFAFACALFTAPAQALAEESATNLAVAAISEKPPVVTGSPQKLVLGEPKDVVIADDVRAVWFTFTPEKDGAYQFVSSDMPPTDVDEYGNPIEIDCGDPLGCLYEPTANPTKKSGVTLLNRNDDGQDASHFRVAARNMKAGTTYYLKCRQSWWERSGSYQVTASSWDPFDISQLSIDTHYYAYSQWTDRPITVQSLKLCSELFETNENWNGFIPEDICKISGFSKREYDYDIYDYVFTPIDGTPTEPGTYYANLTGVAPYTGETSVSFSLNDGFSLDDYYYDVSDWVWLDPQNKVAQTPIADFYRSLDGDHASLEEGKCWRFDGWYGEEYYDDASDEYVTPKLATAPTEPGWYNVRYVGINGYNGERYYEVQVKDPYELGNCYANAFNDRIWPDGKPVSLDVLGLKLLRQVSSADNAGSITIDPAHYSVGSWYVKSGEDDKGSAQYTALSAPPSDPGSYMVDLVPAANSPYTGHTRQFFTILDPMNIGNYEDSATRELWTEDGAPSLSKLNVTLFRDVSGENGSEELVVDRSKYHVGSWWSQSIVDGRAVFTYYTSAPTEPGNYWVALSGDSPYSGTKNVSFQILDSKDISNYSIEYRDEVWADGKPVTLDKLGVSVYREDYANNSQIVIGSDKYTVSWQRETASFDGEDDFYYDESHGFESLESAPKAPGNYRATISGTNSYTGSWSFNFSILDPKSIESFEVGWVKLWAEGPVTPEMLDITSLYASIDGVQQVVTLGTDYTIDSWWSYDIGDPLSGPPSESGGYVAVLKGKGAYTGTKLVEFGMKDIHWFDTYMFKPMKKKVVYTGEPVTLEALGIDVYRYTNSGEVATLTMGTDYKLKSWNVFVPDPSDPEYEQLMTLDTAPKEVGRYVAIFEGIAPFEGELEVPFSIADSRDLELATITNLKDVYTVDELSSYAPTVTAGNGTQLVAGTDFKFNLEYWDSETDEYVSVNAPGKVGEYWLEAAGTGTTSSGYYGATTAWFDVVENPPVPVTPDNPSNPDNPSTPSNPDNPSNPSNPSTPDNPSTPSNPDNPSTPSNPDNPSNPSTPENPSSPSNPSNPSTPSNPSSPSNPGASDNPSNPSTPGSSAENGSETTPSKSSPTTSKVKKKKTNPLNVKTKKVTLKYSKVKKAKQTIKVSKSFKFVKKGKGKITYTLSKAKKGKANVKSKFTIGKTNGKITVKKGTPKGTYKLTIKVRAAGNKTYKAKTKTVTLTIKVVK